ncbi:MAG: FAD-binding protein, partial [Pseudomonadota bacterium]
MLNPVDPSFEAKLKDALPCSAFRELEPRYLEEPRGRYAGADALLVAPASTEDVARVVKLAAEASVPVVPYGGGTGLVGGQISESLPRPVILSMERMTAVRDVFPTENAIVVEAGAILANVQAAAEEVGRLF